MKKIKVQPISEVPFYMDRLNVEIERDDRFERVDDVVTYNPDTVYVLCGSSVELLNRMLMFNGAGHIQVILDSGHRLYNEEYRKLDVLRKCIDVVADLHICTNEYNKSHLFLEDYDISTISVCGNPMLDNMAQYHSSIGDHILYIPNQEITMKESEKILTEMNDIAKIKYLSPHAKYHELAANIANARGVITSNQYIMEMSCFMKKKVLFGADHHEYLSDKPNVIFFDNLTSLKKLLKDFSPDSSQYYDFGDGTASVKILNAIHEYMEMVHE